LVHGRSKTEKALQHAQTEKAERELDHHRRDSGGDS
jgi:hypothetical protein